VPFDGGSHALAKQVMTALPLKFTTRIQFPKICGESFQINNLSSRLSVKSRPSLPGRVPTHRLPNGGDVVWRGAAAAADDVDQAFGCEFVHEAGGHVWGFVKARVAHGVGQAGVGVAADEGAFVHDAVEFLHVGAHEGGAQGAVQADGERSGVAHAVPEGGDGLAGEHAA
jgi:hypothetical protein